MQQASHKRLAALAALISACGSGAETVITLPEGTDHRAAVMVIASERETRVVSLDLEARRPVSLEILEARSGLTLILYQSALADLGLRAGELVLAEPAAASRTIPRSPRLFSSEIEPGRVEPWSPLAVLPDAIRDLRIAAPTLGECAQRGGCLVPSPEDPSDAPICVETCPEPPALEPPATPEPPASAALPVLTPCPAGWTELTEAGVVACEPPPSIATATCASPEVQRYGASLCSELMPCPAGEWPEDLPPNLPRAHVRSGATGGNGSAGAPFGSIGAALASGSGARVIAVARGTYPEVLDLPSGVEVYGACPGEVTVDGASSARPVVTIAGTQVVLQGLTITGGAGGIRVERGGQATIGAILDRGGPGYGLDLDGSIVTADRLAITGRAEAAVQARAVADVTLTDSVLEGSGGAIAFDNSTGVVSRTVVRSDSGARAGVALSAGAELRLESVSFHRTASPVLHVTSGSRVLGTDVAIDRPRVTNGESAPAIAVMESRAELRRVVVRDAVGQGVIVSGAATTATISDLAILGVPSSLSGDPGRAILVRDRARVSIERMRIRDTGGESLLIVGETEAIAADVLASEAGQSSPASCVLVLDSQLTLRRFLASRCTEQGVTAVDGSQLDVEDLTVLDSSRGAAVDDSTGRIGRVHLVRLQNTGLSVVSGARAVASDLMVEDSGGPALFVSGGNGVEVSRARFVGVTPQAVVLIDPRDFAVTSTVSDLHLSWLESAPAPYDRASIYVGSPARLSRVTISGSPATGFAVEKRASAVIEDLRVDGALGRGVHILEQGKVTLRRAQLARTTCNGVFVEGNGVIDAEDVEIGQTLGLTAAGCIAGGTNVYVTEIGQATFERFRFADAVVAGAVVTDVAQLALSQGEIARQPDGAVISSRAQSIEALLDRVRYRQTTRALVIDQ